MSFNTNEQREHKHTQARRYALQVMYQGDMLETSPTKLIDDKCLVSETQLIDDYALSLVKGATEQQEALDKYIVDSSENWSLDRMPIVDRSILRIAAYEMVFVDEVPVSVSINEAVNLAREFGGDDSPRFVNGILGRIAVALEEEADAN